MLKMNGNGNAVEKIFAYKGSSYNVRGAIFLENHKTHFK
jgi:hypothetical protein